MSSSTTHPHLHIHTDFNFNFNFIFHPIEASGRNSSSDPSNPGPDSDWKKLEGIMVDEICSHPQRDFSQWLAEKLGVGDLFEVYLEESSSINKTSREKVSLPFWNTFTPWPKAQKTWKFLLIEQLSWKKVAMSISYVRKRQPINTSCTFRKFLTMWIAFRHLHHQQDKDLQDQNIMPHSCYAKIYDSLIFHLWN